MTDRVCLSLEAARQLSTQALLASRTSEHNARSTARALVAAEADGQFGHGLSRVPSYAAQTRAGKVNGFATPKLCRVGTAAVRIDAGFGFAYPTIDFALEKLPALAGDSGIAVAAIHRSHHFGQAGAHAERLAEQGLLALVFGNSPRAIAFWGGTRPMLGTNPIAFAAPLPDGAPLVIDLALSVAARGKIMHAKEIGETIPHGWAVDDTGQATTDPERALQGSMLAIGGAKGAALALMVEILSAALTGSQFGFEASSLFDADGDPPDLGQCLIAINPQTLSGGRFAERMATIVAVIAEEPGARLPGSRRLDKRRRATRDGVSLPAILHSEIQRLTHR